MNQMNQIHKNESAVAPRASPKRHRAIAAPRHEPAGSYLKPVSIELLVLLPQPL